MPRNVEIKARIDSVESLMPVVAAFASEGPVEIVQDDTFFTCDNGRMKLRAYSDTEGELIFYRRANQHGPKQSFYLRSPTSSPETLREAMSQAYGLAGRVHKHRILFMAGRTRIHLDRVKNLGHFLELEVVLDEGESVEVGIQTAHDLMDKLGIQTCQLVEGAYVDLLMQASSA